MPKSDTKSVTRPDVPGEATEGGPEPESYEQAVAELERLIQAMETAQLPLDDVLRSYQRGALLLAYCRARLEAVENQVQVLEDGHLKPWPSSRDTGS